MVVILSGGVNVVSGVADHVLPSVAPLDLVRLLQRLVVNGFHQVNDQLIHVDADSLNIGLNDPGAVFEKLRLVCLLILCEAGLLGIWLALILENYLLHLVAVGVLVDTIASNVGLANVRVIVLNWRWSWVLGWRRIRSLTIHIGKIGGKENGNESWEQG